MIDPKAIADKYIARDGRAAKPDLEVCSAGISIHIEPCPKCGATSHDECRFDDGRLSADAFEALIKPLAGKP